MSQNYAQRVKIDGLQYFGEIVTIHAITGEGACRRLMEAFGGRVVRIPVIADERPGETHLARVIGEQAVRRLQQEFGGGHIDVPMGMRNRHESGRAQRLKRVRDLTLAGESINTIATQLRVAVQTVANHRRKLRERGDLPRASVILTPPRKPTGMTEATMLASMTLERPKEPPKAHPSSSPGREQTA